MKNFLKKINYKQIVVCYCVILCAILIATSMPYGGDQANTAKRTTAFSAGWDVYADGILEQTDALLPYHVKKKDVGNIEIRNTVPQTEFRVPMLEMVLFQKDVRIYVDGALIKEVVFDQKVFNQQTPGSGRIFVPFPPDSEGKEIVVKIHKVVEADDSHISAFQIIDGQMSDRNIVSLSSPAFIATILMFFVGLCLFITSLVYILGGIQIYSLCSMSLFVITASLWVMCNSKVFQYFIDNWVLMHNLEYISFYSTPLWLWIFLSYNWTRQKQVCKVASSIMAGFLTVVLTAKVLGICDYFVFLKLFHGLVFVNILVILVLGIKDFRHQSTALKMFFAGIGCLSLTSCIDLIRYYTVFAPDDMAFVYIAGTILMGFCLLLTFIMMSKEKFASTVEDSVYKELAYSDILTGLHSRVKWESDILEIQDAMDNYSSILTAMIDVNDLKKVNDHFGHLAGDQMLIAVAEALKNRFDGVGSVYRLGGDEFCVISLNKSAPEMERIFSMVDQDLEGVKREYPLSLAWGYAQYDKKIHENMNDVLRDADNIMYASKRRIKEAGGYSFLMNR